MSTAEIKGKPVSAGRNPAAEPTKADGKREKRTITEIRESKKTGEKMVYMSVPDTPLRNGRRWRASMLRSWATVLR